ncbi:MAG: nucleotidyltransferase substrate binding protein [Magnetococcales bacterium]|nr:nucleotidyltransferase substrate binding protein [Magnetococcales bacterium]
MSEDDNTTLTRMGEALVRLRMALLRDAREDDLVLDATIQRFEFCMELTWKCLKRQLEAEGIQTQTPREALRGAYAAGWINDERLWLGMLQDRNLTSHTYRESLARQIHARIPAYHAAMSQLHALLRERIA